jgi:pentatricopeptide repeat protein
MTRHKLSPDCVTFNAAISSCGDNWMKAMELLEEMICRKIDPDTITYNSLISCLSNALLWQQALFLLKSMKAADLVTRVSYRPCLEALEATSNWQLSLQLFQSSTILPSLQE